MEKNKAAAPWEKKANYCLQSDTHSYLLSADKDKV
jgi:hypothetical protein